MKKKAGIILCVAGLVLCMAGVAAIAYGMGMSWSVRETLARVEGSGSSGTGDEKVAGKQEDVSDMQKPDPGEADKQGEDEKEADKKEEDKKEADKKEEDEKEADKKEEDEKETDKKEEDKKETDKKETDKKEEDKKETDKKEEDNKEGEEKEKDTKEGQNSEIAAPSRCGRLSVDGTKLVDEGGNPVQLRGISSHGLSWFPTYINQDAFRQFRQEWNVNVMRLAMYTHENGGYCTDGNKEDLKNIIYRGVQYATDNDLYVIIDWHVLQEQNPNTYKEEAKKFFDDMSERYKDNNNVIYEICNEPNGDVSWSDVKSYAEEVIGVIRANDENAVILVGTPNWSQRVDDAAADPITGYDNIMYTLHFYAATHKDDLRNTMVNAINDGLPVFVSEYGICDASGNGALDKDSAQKWVDTMNQYGVSYVCWALANKNESAALIKNSSTKTCQFTEEDLSESGKWLYQMLTGNTPESGGTSGGKDNQGGKDDKDAGAEAETFESGGLEGALTLKSSWDADGGKNYQYDLTLTNSGSQATGSWAIDIHFSGDITFSSGWGGNFTVNGNTLHITSLEYNGKIAAGSSLGDIGFIITGPSGLKMTK